MNTLSASASSLRAVPLAGSSTDPGYANQGPTLRLTEQELCELAETRAKAKLGHNLTVTVKRLIGVTGTGEDRTWHFETERE